NGFPETNTAPGESCWCLESGGWFWKEGTRPLITAQQVVNSVTSENRGHANVLLDVGPDKQGRFEKASVKVLEEAGKLLQNKAQ
ncbi:MAG: alpha-L-fucosidase, partial [Verrucomicrobia bacterium]|nr:alpha-L-fucosidase [Verrucomicrobiota bacterium]